MRPSCSARAWRRRASRAGSAWWATLAAYTKVFAVDAGQNSEDVASTRTAKMAYSFFMWSSCAAHVHAVSRAQSAPGPRC